MTTGEAGTVAGTAADLVHRARGGSVGALSRVLTLVQHPGPQAADVQRALSGLPRTAHVVGVTGPPGTGKSTLVAGLAAAWPGQGRIAILAIDPSSPISGGAILGDRVRMKELAGRQRIYVRSIASHGRTGGLAVGIERVIDAVSALGFDAVLVETVGIGQLEVEITGLADTTVAVFAPGQGDIVQAMKSGLNEVVDVLVVNKADRPGADAVFRDLRRLTRGDRAPRPASRPVLKASATEHTGIAQVVAAVRAHRSGLESTGELTERRARRGRLHLRDALEERWSAALAGVLVSVEGERLASDLAQGTIVVDDALPVLLTRLADSLRPGR
ncbi:ArgK/MeaB family GTPase [Tomitella fengzijianii]|uniref:ArgK/MeaB family GTPase n=1 Tax=Tomitella fengzijianii TaxID=2597660 RepID=UPI00131D125D|nr:methylmalonyl Co-A mutase-associated GTPase MeaB [Tomitella fengzijianii]